MKHVLTLVNDSPGDETPIKNPKMIPNMTASKVLFDSFGCLTFELQNKRETDETT